MKWMELQPIKAEILAVRIIPNADLALAQPFQLKPHQRSIGILTCTIDDVGYTAIDEATKQADVKVVYAKSFYAGASHASGPLSGEFIGIIAGPSLDEVISGVEAARIVIENEAHFEAINPEGTHSLYAHCVARTGSYLSKVANIEEGSPLAYLIAPPLEAMFGLDAAFYGLPSETNFGGGLLTGTHSACLAAAEAFRQSILEIARNPIAY
jgi:ethanolamine utilization protein EutL